MDVAEGEGVCEGEGGGCEVSGRLPSSWHPATHSPCTRTTWQPKQMLGQNFARLDMSGGMGWRMDNRLIMVVLTHQGIWGAQLWCSGISSIEVEQHPSACKTAIPKPQNGNPW